MNGSTRTSNNQSIRSTSQTAGRHMVRRIACETLESRQFFNAAAPLDTSFGGGVVSTSFGGTTEVAFGAVTLKNGDLLAFGETGGNGAPVRTALAEYKPDGSLDTSFDGDGKLVFTTAQYNLVGLISRAYVQPSGKILVSGDLGLFRLNTDGSIDTSFGTEGTGHVDEKQARIVMNADGSFRSYSQDTNVMATDTYDVNGKLLSQGPKNVAAGNFFFLPNGNVVVVNNQYRLTWYTANLSKIGSMANYGDTFLDPNYLNFISAGRPWNDSRGVPLNGAIPGASIDTISTTRDGGYLITGIIGGSSAKYPSVSDNGTTYTPYTLRLDSKGNFVGFNLAGDGRTTIDYRGNFSRFDGNLAFGLGDGVNIGLPDQAGTTFVPVMAADGSYYLVGSEQTGDSEHQQWTVLHTKPIVASVTGNVFSDANSDGTKNGADASLANRTVFLDTNGNGKLDAGEYSTTTDASGQYTFANLGPGSYSFDVVTASGETQTNAANVTLSVGQKATLNIGVHSGAVAATGSITGTLFNDDNFDGALDNGETINAGRVVYIDANHNGKLDSGETQTTTNSLGVYTFSGLAAGTYDVKRVLPSNAYRITTSTALVTVTAGGTTTFNIGSTSQPAGNPPPAQTGTITGILFNDDNINGTLDNGETINAGRTVFIDANENGKYDAGEQTTTTDSTGRYTFSNVPVGSYAIGRILPSGYQVTTGLTFAGGREDYISVGAGQTVEADIGSTAKAIVEGITHYSGVAGGPDDPSAIGGVRIYADLNKNGKFDANEPSVLSGQAGRDEFDLALPAGTYRITTDDPALKAEGTNSSYVDVTLGSGQLYPLSFVKPFVNN